MAPSPLDRLREAFRAPPSFGGAPPPEGTPDEEAVPWAEGRRRVRFDPGVPGVRVLALAGLLAAAVAGVYLWTSRPSSQPVPQAAVRPAAAKQATAPAPPGEPSPSTSPATVTVDVAGKVHHPGVVTLPAGARVIDAIDKAGGIRHGAKTETLNLARKVVDGEQILVGITVTPSPSPDPAMSAGASSPGGVVDLNTATATELDRLPGVGPVLAQRIVDYRTQHGGFRSVDELRQVSGIGDAKYADLKALVRV